MHCLFRRFAHKDGLIFIILLAPVSHLIVSVSDRLFCGFLVGGLILYISFSTNLKCLPILRLEVSVFRQFNAGTQKGTLGSLSETAALARYCALYVLRVAPAFSCDWIVFVKCFPF